jgi:hypothetical protein
MARPEAVVSLDHVIAARSGRDHRVMAVHRWIRGKTSADLRPAIVIGGATQGLAVVRSLGERSVPVVVADVVGRDLHRQPGAVPGLEQLLRADQYSVSVAVKGPLMAAGADDLRAVDE